MSQSAMSCAIQYILISLDYSKNTENVLHQIRKATKNHPLDVAKKYVETYFSSNAAARNHEERAFYNEFTRVAQLKLKT